MGMPLIAGRTFDQGSATRNEVVVSRSLAGEIWPDGIAVEHAELLKVGEGDMGRIIDLSYAAAQAMGMSGIAQVRLEIQGVGVSAEPAIFARRDAASSERRTSSRRQP